MRVGSVEIEVQGGGRRRTVRADLVAPPGAPRIAVRGSLVRAVWRALDLTRRDQRSWAVLEASRGRYELVPLALAGSDSRAEVDRLGRLARVPGVTQVTVSKLTARLVAIAGERSPHVFEGDEITITRRDPAPS